MVLRSPGLQPGLYCANGKFKMYPCPVCPSFQGLVCSVSPVNTFYENWPDPLLQTHGTPQCQQSLHPRELHRWTSSIHLLDANLCKGKGLPADIALQGKGGNLAGTHTFLWPQKAIASKKKGEQRGDSFKDDLEKFQLLQGQYHAGEKRWLVKESGHGQQCQGDKRHFPGGQPWAWGGWAVQLHVKVVEVKVCITKNTCRKPVPGRWSTALEVWGAPDMLVQLTELIVLLPDPQCPPTLLPRTRLRSS